jgi:uracil-DNA glycosylase
MISESALSRRQALAILEWYRLSGVDAVLSDEAVNRFEAAQPEVGSVTPRAQAVSRASGAKARDSVSQRAREPSARMTEEDGAFGLVARATSLAEAAASLAELRQNLDQFQEFSLKKTAKTVILPEMVAPGGVMMIGDMPDADDDRQGHAFAGVTGELVAKLVHWMGLEVSSLAKTTAIPWRPPGNRMPTEEEIAVCRPILLRQVALLQPRFVIACGNRPLQILAGLRDPILKERGKWFEATVKDLTSQDRTVPIFAMLPPNYVLKNPIQKRLWWRDAKAFRHHVTVTETQT